jgi:hypothetical protein
VLMRLCYRPVVVPPLEQMITPNFRHGMPMDRSNTPLDEYRYQHRGYAKYADVVRLFGWEAYTAVGYAENDAFERGVASPGSTLGYQARTLRLSMAAGVDLTPLIHFWGIPPPEPTLLASQMATHGLQPSTKVRCLLLRYRSLIPTNNADFNAFFERIHPGRPSVTSDDPRYGRYVTTAPEPLRPSQPVAERVHVVAHLCAVDGTMCGAMCTMRATAVQPAHSSMASSNNTLAAPAMSAAAESILVGLRWTLRGRRATNGSRTSMLRRAGLPHRPRQQLRRRRLRLRRHCPAYHPRHRQGHHRHHPRARCHIRQRRRLVAQFHLPRPLHRSLPDR